MDTRDAATSLAVYAHCARHAPTDPVHWGAVRRARGGAHGAASDGMAHRIRFFSALGKWPAVWLMASTQRHAPNTFLDSVASLTRFELAGDELVARDLLDIVEIPQNVS